MSEPSAPDLAINSRWATTIGDVCDRFGGDVQTGPFGSQLHASDYSDVGTPVVMPQDIQDGRIVCDQIARVGQEHVNSLSRHVLRAGDLVFSRRGDVSRFAVVTGAEAGWLCGTGSIRVRLNSPDIDVGYARRYLQQGIVGKWLRHHAKGVTMPNLNTTIIRGLPFVYPPLSEQRRIAEVLDRAEALRAKRRAALAHLDTLTQSIFLNLFGDPVTNPRQWPSHPLESFFHFTTGKLDSNAAVPEGEYPFFTCAREDYRIDNFAFDCEALLLAGNNAAGEYSVKHHKGKFNAYQRTYVITLQDERNSYSFARFVLEYRLAELKRLSKGTSTKYLTMELLNRIRVPVPPTHLQIFFQERISEVDALKSAHRASLAKLDELFASLQHRAFRGEL